MKAVRSTEAVTPKAGRRSPHQLKTHEKQYSECAYHLKVDRADSVFLFTADSLNVPRRAFSLRSALSSRRRLASGTNTPLGMSQSRRGTQSTLHLERTVSRNTIMPSSSPTSLPALNNLSPQIQEDKQKVRDWQISLWLLAAATFRRGGDMVNAKGTIREAEALDQYNPEVWVQVSHYLRHYLGWSLQCRIEMLARAVLQS